MSESGARVGSTWKKPGLQGRLHSGQAKQEDTCERDKERWVQFKARRTKQFGRSNSGMWRCRNLSTHKHGPKNVRKWSRTGKRWRMQTFAHGGADRVGVGSRAARQEAGLTDVGLVVAHRRRGARHCAVSRRVRAGRARQALRLTAARRVEAARAVGARGLGDGGRHRALRTRRTLGGA